MPLRVLGPVELCAERRVWDAGSPQQRLTLAALAVDAGRPVTPETLVDRVWDEAPHGARRALQVHITRIRRLLERVNASGELSGALIRRSGGYVLDIDPDEVDLHRFRRLVHQARAATDRGTALTQLREARALWTGTPLTGLGGNWATHCRHAWQQQYLDATVSWAHAEILAGTPEVPIPVLGDLVGEHPLAEALTAALMRALFAAGRPAEALERYTAARRYLMARARSSLARSCFAGRSANRSAADTSPASSRTRSSPTQSCLTDPTV